MHVMLYLRLMRQLHVVDAYDIQPLIHFFIHSSTLPSGLAAGFDHPPANTIYMYVYPILSIHDGMIHPWILPAIHSPTHPSFHSFIPAISIAPLQALYYSEALPTTARILYRSFTPKRTGNCRYRTCPKFLHGG